MQRVRGFTLIELMIVLVVAAILLAIALPSYEEQVRRSRRTEAMGGLSDLQLRQERWRASHRTYGTGAQVIPPVADHYTIVVTAASNDATDVAMTATPTGAQAVDKCGTYTLRIDNNNNNAPAGRLDKTTSTGVARCW